MKHVVFFSFSPLINSEMFIMFKHCFLSSVFQGSGLLTVSILPWFSFSPCGRATNMLLTIKTNVLHNVDTNMRQISLFTISLLLVLTGERWRLEEDAELHWERSRQNHHIFPDRIFFWRKTSEEYWCYWKGCNTCAQSSEVKLYSLIQMAHSTFSLMQDWQSWWWLPLMTVGLNKYDLEQSVWEVKLTTIGHQSLSVGLQRFELLVLHYK